ncbi:MAG: phosphoglucosamine mutase [Thermoplasmata archaeon]|nr:MAG: phosphoglucosamine mutase [Thermoplasmata archaeon]
MRLFGSSGIRGVVGKEINPELGLRIGMALGYECKEVVVGMDTRTSSPMLQSSIISGITAVGGNAHLAGVVPTPTLAYVTRHFDAGVMVTASHNPPEYNGVKLWNRDGMAYTRSQSLELEKKILDENIPYAPWNSVGSLYQYPNAVQEHMGAIMERVGEVNGCVVVDCGCGATSVITPYLIRALGAKVIALNSQLDGFFPGRVSEPRADAIKDAISLVREKNADLGIAHDGDGDRVVFITGKGEVLESDRVIAVLAHTMNVRRIVVPVNASRVIEDFNPQAEVVRTRVGDVFVAEEMKKHNAEFGGEPSGTYIFSNFSYCPDGIYMAALFANLATEHGIIEEFSNLPKYHTVRKNISFDTNEAKIKFMHRFIEESGKFEGEITNVDGVRVDMENGWFLVRPSGTEPKVRITIEALSAEDVKNIEVVLDNAIKKCMEDLQWTR